MSAIDILNSLTKNGYDTGILEIYYDFYHNSSGIINQDASLNQQISGQIISNGLAANSEYSNTGKIFVSGYDFFGGIKSPSGDFNANYIKIHNPNLAESDEFTILIAGGLRKAEYFNRTGVYTGAWPSATGHVIDSYPIFSNRETGLYCADGFELGLTNSNLLYFEGIDPQKLQPFSACSTSVGALDNIWAVRYNGNNLDIGRFNIFEEDFDLNSFNLNGLNHGDNWYLGSGINVLNKFFGTSVVSGNSLLGNLKRFLYLSQPLDDQALKDAGLSLFGELNSGALQYENISAIETGITGSGITYVTGVTGYTFGLVNVTGTTGETFTYFELLTGTIVNGATYYLPYQTITGTGIDYATGYDQIFEELVNTGTSITGITGFNVLTGYSYQETGVWDYYTTTPLTGILEEVVEYLYGSGTGAFVTGSGDYTYSDSSFADFYPNSRTYLDVRFSTGDFVEHMTGILQTGDYTVNKNGIVADSSYFPGVTPAILDFEDQDEINLFVNGVARFSSGLIINSPTTITIEYISGDTYMVRDCQSNETVISANIQQIIRENQELQYSLQGDWFLTGNEILESLPFTGQDADTLWSTYDINQSGNRTVYMITGTQDHTGIRSNNIPELLQEYVFFNGQKLYSGQHFSGHYNGSYTEFRPFGWITGETGAYFTLPTINELNSLTGNIIYDTYNTQMRPKSFLTYINGIRTNNSVFIEHDTRGDLITGVDVFSDAIEEVFNNGS